ncbi:MAG: hypothetical protein KGN39_03850, partial [Betaproteobacteria bacterium]|nr:hypothetical protein [Betaproteobacteria bacterium]
ALPFTPLGAYFGFVPPPARFYFILAAMVAAYLLIVEAAKHLFYRRYRSYRPSGASSVPAPGP